MVKRDRRPHTFTLQWPLAAVKWSIVASCRAQRRKRANGALLSLCPLLSAVTSPLFVTRDPFSADR